MNKALALLLYTALAFGCTIAPHSVVSHHTSIGLSGRADSGIVAVVTPAPRPVFSTPGVPVVAPIPAGYSIDSKALAKYNNLIERYGKDSTFHPSLAADDDVTKLPDGSIILGRQGMRNFILMSQWSTSGAPAVATPKPSLLDRLLH